MQIFRFWGVVADAFLQDAQAWTDSRGALAALLVWLIVFRYRLKPIDKPRLFDHLVEGGVSLAPTAVVVVTVLMLAVILYYRPVVYSQLDTTARSIETERNHLEQELNDRLAVRPPNLP